MRRRMNETDQYILDAIRTWIWSGFYGADDVQDMIGDILEDGADEAFLRSQVDPEFEKKLAAEASWPAQTDCDRLDEAFEILNSQGIIALQNAGYTMSDGHSDVGEELHERGWENVQGYCFYHGQDLERAVGGGGLMIAFGDLEDVKTKKGEIGNTVKLALESAGLAVKWNGDTETRLEIPNLDWKRRSPA
jgi:hypothetical protein